MPNLFYLCGLEAQLCPKGPSKALSNRGILTVIFILAFLTPGCLDFGGGDTESSTSADGPISMGCGTLLPRKVKKSRFSPTQ